ncbi:MULTISPECIES: hypothetical protein [unclassified Nitratiruptor]|uniref:hypothetical protein n=1 Tax=unclassified Nitratiruptor TaxID=2624044 RepID=UPI0018EC94CC|nr:MULTISPECIES: hypothetical protein [unclassified Nitratiruptor]
MLTDLNQFEALWSEIRQSQYLTEKELERLEELIKALQSLINDISNIDTNFNKNFTNIIKISQKINYIYQKINELQGMLDNKFDSFLNEISKELDRFVENIEYASTNSAKQLSYQLQHNYDEISQKYEDLFTQIQVKQEEINKDIINRFNIYLEKLKEIANKKSETINDEIKRIDNEIEKIQNFSKKVEKDFFHLLKKIDKKTNEKIEDFEKQTFVQRWGAVGIALTLGFVIGVGVNFANHWNWYREIAQQKYLAMQKEMQEEKEKYQEKIREVDKFLGNGIYEDFIEKHNIRLAYGNNGEKYVAVPIDKSIEVYENRDYRIIQLR